MKRLKIEGGEIKAREEDAFQHFCAIGGFNLHLKTSVELADHGYTGFQFLSENRTKTELKKDEKPFILFSS